MKMKDINEKNDNIEISDDLDKKDALLSSNSDNNEENKIDNEKIKTKILIMILMKKKKKEFFLDYTFMISFSIIFIQKNIALHLNMIFWSLAMR